jgi:hypothetical protein
MKKTSVIIELAALKGMDIPQLKGKWREICEGDPPNFNRAYLESRLAYRIQELAHNGLSKPAHRRIAELREELVENKPRTRIDPNKPPIGAVLVREFKGVEHRVRVVPGGFEYQGRSYTSLSAIASQIAGTRWNGPLFFGLRNKRRKP